MSTHPAQETLDEHLMPTLQKPSSPSNRWSIFRAEIRIAYAKPAVIATTTPDSASTLRASINTYSHRWDHAVKTCRRWCRRCNTAQPPPQPSTGPSNWCTTPRMMPPRGKQCRSAVIIRSMNLGFPSELAKWSGEHHLDNSFMKGRHTCIAIAVSVPREGFLRDLPHEYTSNAPPEERWMVEIQSITAWPASDTSMPPNNRRLRRHRACPPPQPRSAWARSLGCDKRGESIMGRWSLHHRSQNALATRLLGTLLPN
jgi:hypothetical protein